MCSLLTQILTMTISPMHCQENVFSIECVFYLLSILDTGSHYSVSSSASTWSAPSLGPHTRQLFFVFFRCSLICLLLISSQSGPPYYAEIRQSQYVITFQHKPTTNTKKQTLDHFRQKFGKVSNHLRLPWNTYQSISIPRRVPLRNWGNMKHSLFRKDRTGHKV